MKKQEHGEFAFDALNIALLTVGVVVCMYPLYFVVIASFSDPTLVNSGQVLFWPRGISWEGYQELMTYRPLWRGYANTILYTTVGTTLNVVVTLLAGYALSRQDLPGRNGLMFFFAFTMLFSGGLIPRYLVVRNLGLLNTMWAMVLPTALGVYYLIICRTFFATTVPNELLDSARIDGAGNTTFFLRVVLPISPALIAILILYYAVQHWNTFFDALIFLTDRDRHPLQLVLRSLIIMNESSAMDTDPMAQDAKQRLADLIKYGAIVVSSLPVMILYPFLQRYFVKGVMIGSIKG